VNGLPRRVGTGWHRLSRNGKRIVVGALVAVAVAIVLVTQLGSRPTVLFIGDSLTYQSTAALTQDATARGFTASVYGVAGSGILDTQTNWLARAKFYIAAEKPATVVVEFIGDYGLYGTLPGVADRSPSFYAQWAARAQQLEDVLAADGAIVYWVIGPPLQSPTLSAELAQIDGIYSHLKVPGAGGAPPLIDTTKAFGTVTGAYTPTVSTRHGTPVTVRLPDGIHFTPAGISLFAKTLTAHLGG
jgi:hypothetical protein